MSYEYIEKFKKYGFGLFCHFGLYSVLEKGEWALHCLQLNKEDYFSLINSFNPDKDWAKNLVATAKKAGCKYITLTTRHHEGFSLYDTCGLNEFDSLHSSCKRDLVREFVNACNDENILPFFYHTLLDWYNPNYYNDFPKYIDYLIKSVEILCKNYGKIGGLWFDGYWDKPNADWQFDRLYATIRKYQPEAMIINNTGLSELGKVPHPEIDSVTFERGLPVLVTNNDKPIAGEMCEGITDHWGYTNDDLTFRSVPHLLETLLDCRKYNCNFLLNAGPKGDGFLTAIETEILTYIGKWINTNKEVVYNAIPADVKAENADIFTDGDYYYATIRKVPMRANANVSRIEDNKIVKLFTDKTITNATWLDDGSPIELLDGTSFKAKPFEYGTSLYIRVAKFKLK